MPTIELISIDCTEVPELPDFESFSFEAESKLESHRGIFQPMFDEVSGVIVHLADKTEDGKFGICGGNLIEWDDEIVIIPEHDETLDVEDQWNGEDQYFKFRFEPSIIPELKTLIEILMQFSPRKEVWFSTDIQFGPSETSEEYTTLERFFNQTEFSELDWHRLYKIKNWDVI